jgi:hypothetical protein
MENLLLQPLRILSLSTALPILFVLYIFIFSLEDYLVDHPNDRSCGCLV